MKRIVLAFSLFAICLLATTVMAQSPSAQATAQATATAPPKVLPVPQAAVIYQTAPAPVVTYQAVSPVAQAAVTYQANSALSTQSAVLVLPGPALPQPAPCAGNCPQLSLLATTNANANASATAFATATATVSGGTETAMACWHPFRRLKAVLKIRR